ncbi:MAG: phosphatidate cytidylyltransferase [Phycisphaerales bacterium]|nr:phosphatidate cytidylyltransferase [Phycisphaerales bacterium]
MPAPDRDALILAAAVGGLLAVATAVGRLLRRRVATDAGRRTIDNFNARVAAWWVMALVFGAAISFGLLGACVLFGLVSFFALREMITLTPTRLGDHHALFWAFFVIPPIQYVCVYVGWQDFWSIFVPVYCFLFLAVRSTLLGDTRCYLERTAKIQWALMICVYFVSHAPALLTLASHEAAGMVGAGTSALAVAIPPGSGWKLLVWLVVVVQMSDVLQYVWGKLLGRRKIAPTVSPSKTWEGFAGGVLSATAVGVGLSFLTPFDVRVAIGMGLTVCLMGFFGGIVMSAIKRDAGVKDYGALIAGHGGMMDRIDSLTFAAPVFYRLVRHYYP